MTNGCDPLSPDEYLLRRIPADGVDLNAPLPIPWSNFKPKSKDTDGISLFRESYKTPQSLVDTAIGKGPYYVVRIQVKQLTEIGLTARITGELSEGHVSIAEMNPQAQANSPEETIKKAVEISERSSIVLGPVKPVIKPT